MEVFAVSELNRMVKAVLESVPELENVYVRGEISNYKFYPSSGHHYFSLKDEGGTVRCVFFKSQAMSLRFQPQNGMKAIASGRVSVFPRDGTYQLYCSSLHPDGAGDLHAAFEQLKERLWKEGLFALEHKKPLPAYPETIGIVTSPVGAAVHDMIRILRRRYPLAKVLLLPVRVQGPEAPPAIVRAIRYACENKVADVLIVGRGGGSAEDLWAFNDEQVARTIYHATIPIVSAVGHEPDVTIADFVADARAATPTHAAEMVSPDRAELSDRLLGIQAHLLRLQSGRVEALGKQLENLAAKRTLTDPMAFVEDKRMLLGHVQRELFHAAETRMAEPARKLAAAAASLDALSPLRVLGRGYAMVTDEQGNVLRRAADAAVGGRTVSRLADGTLFCRVEEIVLEENDRV
jgi:exodeoxyribonuclease VII large subunit